MEESLTLAGTAIEGTGRTVIFDLGNVSANGTPAFYLPLIVRASTAVIIAAIPLEPPARVFRVDPTFRPPNRQRLRGIYPKEVEAGVVAFGTKFGF